jgi:hypothetical protein
MDETSGGGAMDGALAETTALEATDGTLRLGRGLSLADLALEPSHCGQYLLIYCAGEMVAIYGAMGGSVQYIEFADGGCHAIEEVLDRFAGSA